MAGVGDWGRSMNPREKAGVCVKNRYDENDDDDDDNDNDDDDDIDDDDDDDDDDECSQKQNCASIGFHPFSMHAFNPN
ncbi:hypothetical protein V1478_014765 [Vespula squamosa]|uniref:Uncharacterized protein n=1 Tax=Vespula squamosa TaxID=30214 RepID=A0ABD2A369_VESSQ